jgi:hypothetical protein
MLNLTELERFSNRFADLAKRQGFAARGPMAHRHDSVQIVFFKFENDVARFVTLAITEENQPPDVRVELYATVEDQRRSTRKQVASFLISPGDLADFLSGDTAEKAFDSAAHEALSMRPSVEKLNAYPFGSTLRALRAETNR